MKTTLNLLLAASPAMAELATHLPLSLPSLTAGVYFFPVSTSAKVAASGRLAYGAPIRVADPVGVWAVEAPAAAGASPVAACRPADVRDAADDLVARRCDGAGPGGLLVSMKDSGVAFACYCGTADEEGPAVAAQTEDQRGWNKRGDDDAQRGWNKRGDDDAQRGWNKRGDDDAQRGWNKRGEDDSTEQVTTTGVQRGWHKRHVDDQRGWNQVSADAAAAMEPQQQPETRADTDKPFQAQDQRGWNKRADADADKSFQAQDQRGWNKRAGADKPVQATGVQRGWHRRAMAQRGML